MSKATKALAKTIGRLVEQNNTLVSHNRRLTGQTMSLAQSLTEWRNHPETGENLHRELTKLREENRKLQESLNRSRQNAENFGKLLTHYTDLARALRSGEFAVANDLARTPLSEVYGGKAEVEP